MKLIKYPRTPHLPWSPGRTKDDHVLLNTSCFEGKQIVMTYKMDGENTTMYSDHIHARSLDSRDHPSRHYVKNLWAQTKHQIPEGWRICGENLYAKHSIHYKYLEDYFMIFSIWDETNTCLSYWDIREYSYKWGLTVVPTMAIAKWDDDLRMKNFFDKRFYYADPDNNEGYVIQSADGFHYDDFGENVAKYVREKHVQTDKHWMRSKMVINKLKE